MFRRSFFDSFKFLLWAIGKIRLTRVGAYFHTGSVHRLEIAPCKNIQFVEHHVIPAFIRNAIDNPGAAVIRVYNPIDFHGT